MMKRRNQFLIVGLLLLWSGAAQGAFKFIGWADNRPYDAANRARFRWALQEMNGVAGGGPLFHIVPGDFDLTAQTNEDIMNISSVKTWHYAPGNHDVDHLTESHWSMDVENVHFVFLNEYLTGDGRVGDSDYNWLVNDLNANTKPAVFIIGHEPAFPENRHVGDSLDAYPEERDRFWNLLNERQVLAYICGHTHVYSTYSDATGPTVQIDLGNAGNPSITGNPQTFVIFDVTDQQVDAYVYDGFQDEPYSGGFSFSMPIPAPVYKAQNPSPADGAANVPTSTTLTWTAGAGAVSHDVWLWETGSTPVRVSDQQAGTSYTPTLESETQYSWRIDEHYSGQPVVTGDVWSFTTRPSAVDCYVIGETPVTGSVTGSGQTDDSDDAYESITEVLNNRGKNGYSTLEHIWRFDVLPGQHVELRIEAYHTPSADGDDFELSYSTDGASYTSLLTVTKTQDNDSEQVYALPPTTSGAVYVKVQDTNRARGSQDIDTFYVDRLRIVSSDSAGTATSMTASVATSTTKASGPDVYGVATVTVVDNLGAPVADAMVEGSFTGDFWFVSRGPTATDAAGKVTFTTEPSSLKRPSFGFEVTAVTHPSLIWQP